MAKTEKVLLDNIDIHGGTQTRVLTHDEAVVSYAEAMESGAPFPPITLFYDGSKYWLADGFHRYLAARSINHANILAEIHDGGRTEALKCALGANATNGLFRTAEDKRNSVKIALEEWWDYSTSYIAEICQVSDDLVNKIRQSMDRAMPEMVTGKDGKQYPAKVERQPRGETEKSSSDGEGGGGGGKPSKKNMDFNENAGGSGNEIESEARKMIRDGEIDPRELPKLKSAIPTDYAYAAINLLGYMDPMEKKYNEALQLLKRWIDKQLEENC